MLCIRSGVSCTGTSGVSIFRSGIFIADCLTSVDGPAATGCTSPDIGVFIALGCFAKWERYAQIPARTTSMAIQTRDVLKTYLFIAVSLLSAIRDGLKQFRDLRASAHIRASDLGCRRSTRGREYIA